MNGLFEHVNSGTCYITDTLLQPRMNRRKSVTKLSEKDTKDANKYVLTHQQLDFDGDLQTQLVKVSNYLFL